jgi:Zn-finger nucleic acid-binding protein
MKCPACKDVALLMSDRHGVEIDYCPHCRGVWLDRGELDKIIERAAAAERPPERQEPRPRGGEPHRQHDHGHYHGQSRRRESFLGNLFDFD